MLPLVALCTNSDDPVVLANAAGALANLALDEGSRVQITRDGARPLVNLLISHPDSQVLATAAEALSNLAFDEQVRS